ncbi:MAG TPA: helix-turn-helix domain-containing protein [Candidatus Saccharimonadales bacterium]|nr:helix-turn-helix domain-containing protein [Candidatus Saccharimonadales bacterium]
MDKSSFSPLKELGAAEQVGQQLRQRRLAYGLSQTELARWAGTTQSAIAKLEAGLANPTLSTLEALAGAFDQCLKIRFSG